MNGNGLPRNLSPRELIFVHEVMAGRCHAEAARRAGYSPKWSGRIAYTVLHRPAVAEYIKSHLARMWDEDFNR